MSDFIPIARVELTDDEIEAAVEVLRSGQLIQGPQTRALEAAFAETVGARHAVAVSSGTSALHIVYSALFEPGDEVLVPAFSHISTASMVSLAGCTPVFCDIDPQTYTLDVGDARKRITPNTRGIVPVHLFGNACEVDGIVELARDRDLRIVWDAAQAHGTRYRGADVGSFDDAATYSFYPTKNMVTGEGGMITTNDDDLAEQCRLLRSHGQTEKYYHPSLGYNYRMTDVESAIGLKQLEKLDDRVAARRRNAERITQGLSDLAEVQTPVVSEGVEHSYHQYTIALDLEALTCSRNEFGNALQDLGIGNGVHYPRPLHRQPAFEERLGVTSLPISEGLAERVLSLPVHPTLTSAELDRVIRGVRDVVEQTTSG